MTRTLVLDADATRTRTRTRTAMTTTTRTRTRRPVGVILVLEADDLENVVGRSFFLNIDATASSRSRRARVLRLNVRESSISTCASSPSRHPSSRSWRARALSRELANMITRSLPIVSERFQARSYLALASATSIDMCAAMRGQDDCTCAGPNG